MAHCLLGAPLVVIDSNGALWTRCAISMYGKMEKKIHTSGAPCLRCAISVFHTNGVSQTGAPLVYSSGALLPRCAIRINPIYSPFPSSGKRQKVNVQVLLGSTTEQKNPLGFSDGTFHPTRLFH